MSGYRNLLHRCWIKNAGQRRECSHSKKHVMVKGEPVLEIKVGMTSPDGYCAECARIMLSNAKMEIDKMLKQLT